MPRTARELVGDIVYHAINRGNGRGRVFHDSADYERFLHLIALANERIPMRILAYCLMPNHFHFVVWPRGDEDLGRWMQWLLTTHVRRHHAWHESSGRIWEGRFKTFPIQQDDHLLTVLRYVERNAATANLVERAEDWRWGSLWHRSVRKRPAILLSESPVEIPPDWIERVNVPITEKELLGLRTSTATGRPYGDAVWTDRIAQDLGLESSLRARGRPKAAV